MASVALIWFQVIWTLCVTLHEALTHKALCLSWARIWSFGFNPNLWGNNLKNKERQWSWVRGDKDNCEWGEVFKLTCQGNLCPQQLKCQARDFPSQKVCFHCVETDNILYYADSHSPALYEQRKQTSCCGAENHLILIVVPRLTHGSGARPFQYNLTWACVQYIRKQRYRNVCSNKLMSIFEGGGITHFLLT